ncbi:MAG TPA: hypothetical protein PLC99_20060 [Verrucomicrobiota bacterium]|nr:hypothetical protein [Verrucomicrobiota bacterium]
MKPGTAKQDGWGLRPQGRGEHFKGRTGKAFLEGEAGQEGQERGKTKAHWPLARLGNRTGTSPEGPTLLLKGGAQQEGQEWDRAFFLKGRTWGLGAAARGATGQEEGLLLKGEAEKGRSEGGTQGADFPYLADGIHLEGRCSGSGFGLVLPLKRSLSLLPFLLLGFLVLANYSFFVGCAHGQA